MYWDNSETFFLIKPKYSDDINLIIQASIYADPD